MSIKIFDDCSGDFDVVEKNPSVVGGVPAPDKGHGQDEPEMSESDPLNSLHSSRPMLISNFDPEKGYVIDGEDPLIMASLGIDLGKRSLARKPMAGEIDAARIASLRPEERDIERFSWI